VKLVDANVLLYAVNEDAPLHTVARRWLDRALSGTERVGLTWIVLLAFLRLSTHPAVFSDPLDLADAAGIVRGWLDAPAATVLHPTARHADILSGLLSPTGTAANLVNDAHLAALALEHGGEVVSFDADFARFPGVRWTAPGDATGS
jgi:uncharacterized protein